MPSKKIVPKKQCPICKLEKETSRSFYKSSSPLFALDGRVPVCIACVKDDVTNEDETINVQKLQRMLKMLDKPWYMDSLNSAYEEMKRKFSSLSDDEIAKKGKDIVGIYFKNINSFCGKGKSYEDSEKDGFMHQGNGVSNTEKKKIIGKYSTEQTDKGSKLGLNNELETIWSEQDIKNKDFAIEVIGYDPFDGYPEISKKFLFNSLSPYLEDDDNVDDAYKLSQILQIIENNSQIRICDKRIANLDPIKDAPDIKTLQDIKRNLVASNDKIAKENEISVKNRSNKDAGKSTLTFLMRDLREKDFEKAEADYYDQLRSEGTQWAISISQKAILDHCIFDENDKKEIYESQIKLIDELYKELDEKKEEIRLLLTSVDELTSKLNELDPDGLS